MYFRLFGICGVLLAASLVLLALLPALPAPDRALLAAVVVLACGLATLGIALWRARRVLHALEEFALAADRVAAGEYGSKVDVPGPAEVSDLAQAFNRMSEQLSERVTLLEEDRQQLRMILSGMIEGVIAIDSAQHILFANERGLTLLDLPSQQVVGRKLWEVVRRRALQDVVQRALAQPEPRHEELLWNGAAAKNLTIYAARMSGAPPRGAILVINDTSVLRRLERLREEFVANVGHELKTPLAAIKASTETLLEGAAEDPEHRRAFLDRIAEQAERLHALILDLLSLARIESGAETFTFERVALDPVIAACMARHRAAAEAKNQVLARGSDGDGDVAVWADEEAVGQILDNLVDNAIKYTATGGTVRVRAFVDGDVVCLEVTDNGIGIPEGDLARVFERFYRVDKARSRELGGTGLGLSIVKHLTQSMQGTVHAQSQIGKGSTFQVRLPRAT